MDKIAIEYNEMEQLYVNYFDMEYKLAECIQSIGALTTAFQNTFIVGASAKHLTDEANEQNSVVGLARISIKLEDLLVLITMVRLHIETTTTVMQDLDNKIKESIITGIQNKYGVTNDQAREAYNQVETTNLQEAEAQNLTKEDITKSTVYGHILSEDK